MNRYYSSLTSLRGVAAVMVVLYHLSFCYASPGMTSLVGRGYLWVDFFFILSGFVISCSSARLFEPGFRPAQMRNFLAARAARIYPVHFTVMMILFAKEAAKLLTARNGAMWERAPFSGPMSIPRFVLALLLLDAYGFVQGSAWNIVSWSISAEILSYLSFPAMIFFLRRKATWFLAGVAVLCVAGLAVFAGLNGGGLNVSKGASFFRCLLGFPIGMAAWLAFERRAFDSFWSSPWLLSGCAALIALALGSGRVPDVALVPLFAALVLSAAASERAGTTALTARALTALGDVSYSLYLVHPLVLNVFMRLAHILLGRDFMRVLLRAGGTTLVLVNVALCIAAAALMHRLVEVPARGWLRRKLSVPPPEGAFHNTGP